MTQWMARAAAPYPTAADRDALAKTGGITPQQVTYWFSNARKRIWKVGPPPWGKPLRARSVELKHAASQPHIVAAGVAPPTPGRPKKARLA